MRIANPEMSRKRRTKAAPSSISSWQKEKKRKHSTIDSSVPKTKHCEGRRETDALLQTNSKRSEATN